MTVGSLCAIVAGGLAAMATISGPESISDVNQRMREFVDAKEIAGAVTLVATKSRVVHLDSVGMADISAGRPMKSDDIFWIASMTKPITGTAVLMMEEEGKLSV